MKNPLVLLALVLLGVAPMAFGCTVNDGYKEAIRAHITAANPGQDDTIYIFYMPAKARIGADPVERCVVRCDYSPGSKKSGRQLMIVQGGYYLDGGAVVPVALSDVKWLNGEPKKDTGS
jgi:hypothetical protein